MPKTTRTLIIKTFERLLEKKKFEKITVTQIVESCDINRKTFYYYFRDTDDLLEKSFDFEIRMFAKSLPDDIPIYESVEKFFSFVSDNRDIIYHVANCADTENIETHLYRTIYDMISGDIEKRAQGRNITETQIEIISGVYTHTAIGIIIRWLDEGMKGNPVEFFGELDKIVRGALPLMFSNCEKINELENK